MPSAFVLLVAAQAVTGDYRSWVNGAKQPGFVVAHGFKHTLTEFRDKFKIAKDNIQDNNLVNLDFDPLNAEVAIDLLDKMTTDYQNELKNKTTSKHAIETLGGMLGKKVLDKTKIEVAHSTKPAWNKIISDSARNIRHNIARGVLDGATPGENVELDTTEIDFVFKRNYKTELTGKYMGKEGMAKFKLPSDAPLPDEFDVSIHTNKAGSGAWADGDGRFRVKSPVVGMELFRKNGTRIRLHQMQDLISIRFPNTTSDTPGFCAWWDKDAIEWSGTGCSRNTQPPADGMGEECKCNHLTEFALVTEEIAITPSPTPVLETSSEDSQLNTGQIAGLAVGGAAVAYVGSSQF